MTQKNSGLLAGPVLKTVRENKLGCVSITSLVPSSPSQSLLIQKGRIITMRD
ncbi:hypothetical protein YC2023_059762 [Brassica napus]